MGIIYLFRSVVMKPFALVFSFSFLLFTSNLVIAQKVIYQKIDESVAGSL